MITYSFYQYDTRVQQYAGALRRRGDTVDVIALRPERLSKLEIVDGVNVYGIQHRARDERGLLPYLVRILRFFFHSALMTSRRHIANPYQLIHVHSVPDFLVFAGLIPKLCGVPVILDIHDILPEFYSSKFNASPSALAFKFLLLVEKASATFANHVIIANHLWHERLLSRSTRAEKCTPIRNYPDPRIFVVRPKGRSDEKFLMMYPGTLNSHQGVDIAIKAFAKIKNQLPNAEFRIYGEGPTKPQLVTLAAELGLNGRVLFKDFVPIGQIARLMPLTDWGWIVGASRAVGADSPRDPNSAAEQTATPYATRSARSIARVSATRITALRTNAEQLVGSASPWEAKPLHVRDL